MGSGVLPVVKKKKEKPTKQTEQSIKSSCCPVWLGRVFSTYYLDGYTVAVNVTACKKKTQTKKHVNTFSKGLYTQLAMLQG